MVKGSGSIREGRAEDGKLCSHLEWPYSVTHSGGRPVGTALEKLVKMCLTNTAGLIKSRVVYTHFDI